MCEECTPIAFPKPNGKPIPVCIGESLRRLALGALHNKLNLEFEKTLRPNQFGLSMDGTTQAVNELDAYLQSHEKSIMLVLDFKNAFNSVLRSRIPSSLQKHLPSMLGLFDAFYATDSEVVCWTVNGWENVPMPKGGAAR